MVERHFRDPHRTRRLIDVSWDNDRREKESTDNYNNSIVFSHPPNEIIRKRMPAIMTSILQLLYVEHKMFEFNGTM